MGLVLAYWSWLVVDGPSPSLLELACAFSGDFALCAQPSAKRSRSVFLLQMRNVNGKNGKNRNSDVNALV